MAFIKISLIIPFHGDDRCFLQKTLPFLQEHHTYFHEIFIISTDKRKPRINHKEIQNLTILKSPKGRGMQMARGADYATGEWLLFLHADTFLAGSWQNAIYTHVNAHPQKSAVFTLKFDGSYTTARIVEFWVKIRNYILALPYGDQGLFIKHTLYRECGGYRRDYPLMEDVDIICKLKRQHTIKHLDAFAVTSFEKYAKEGLIKRGGKNLFFLLWFFMGGSPTKIYRSYYKNKNHHDA